jgi:hypothetical protein
MKNEQISQLKALVGSKPLTLGDFVVGVYRIWGKRKAQGIIQLAFELNLIKFQGTERFVIS